MGSRTYLRRRVWMALGVAIAATVVTSVAPLPAVGARPPRGRTIDFVATFTDPGSRVTPGALDASSGCQLFEVSGQAVFQGQLRAVDTYRGCVSVDPLTIASRDPVGLRFAGSTDDVQDGWLEGCGTGTFVMHQENLTVTSADPVAGTWHLHLDWSVRSGTGAFVGASGNGTGDADFTAPTATNPPTVPNSGTYQGTIVCPHH